MTSFAETIVIRPFVDNNLTDDQLVVRRRNGQVLLEKQITCFNAYVFRETIHQLFEQQRKSNADILSGVRVYINKMRYDSACYEWVLKFMDGPLQHQNDKVHEIIQVLAPIDLIVDCHNGQHHVYRCEPETDRDLKCYFERTYKNGEVIPVDLYEEFHATLGPDGQPTTVHRIR